MTYAAGLIFESKIRTVYENLRENTLDLRNITLGNNEINLLKIFLNKTPKIHTIYLNENKLPLSGIINFSSMLQENLSGLQSVSLRSSALGNQGVKPIATALKKNITVTNLDLQNNSINSTGAIILSELITENTTLNVLDLSNNQLGDYGVSLISSAIKVNGNLKILHLKFNGITDNGGKTLSSALKVNRGLSGLSLENNDIKEATLSIINNQLLSRRHR